MWTDILQIAALIVTIIAGTVTTANIIRRWLRHIREREQAATVSQNGWEKFWPSLKRSRSFMFSLGVLVASAGIYGVATGYEYWRTESDNVRVLSYLDFRLEHVTVDEELDKAIVYGSMSRSIAVPRGKTGLIVEIAIPSNGWGEGLAGPEGSTTQIEVDGQVKYERITADMPYHHGWYYKYECGDRFSNIFDVTGKDNIVLAIRMVSGAHMDFKQATLTFQ